MSHDPRPTRSLRLPLTLLLTGALLVACGDSPTAPPNAPADHSVQKDGAFHAPGFNSPQGTCTTCHGADLRGGANGEPSCFTCHGSVWG
jgi:cytochrome c5